MRLEPAEIALRENEDAIVRAAVDMSRQVLGVDAAFAAVSDQQGAMAMRVLNGIDDPRFSQIQVRAGLGLGGLVMAAANARTVHDYFNEPSITRDYMPVIRGEGLRGIACVPVVGPQGVQALLYAATRTVGAPGDLAVAQLEQFASFASIGLHHAAARARERELAILRERQRLATSLHDSVAQMLFTIGVTARKSLEEQDPEALAARMQDIEATATSARQELRSTLTELSRPEEGVAFESMFESELRLFERQTGIGVWITRHGAPRALSQVVEELILDSAREGLCNAAKHGHGRTVLANLSYGPERILFALQTETRQPPPEAPTQSVPGSGLASLASRADALHGRLDFDVGQDGVAVLRLELPARPAPESPS